MTRYRRELDCVGCRAAPVPSRLSIPLVGFEPTGRTVLYRAAATRVQAGRVYQFHHSGK